MHCVIRIRLHNAGHVNLKSIYQTSPSVNLCTVATLVKFQVLNISSVVQGMEAELCTSSNVLFHKTGSHLLKHCKDFESVRFAFWFIYKISLQILARYLCLNYVLLHELCRLSCLSCVAFAKIIFFIEMKITTRS